MTQPTTEVPAPGGHDDALLDAVAEELLADAVADLDTSPDLPSPPGGGQPDMGATTPTPDMGDPVTQPTNQPAPTGPAPASTTPAPPGPPAQPPPPGQPPAQPATAPDTGTDTDAFPANTPVADMTAVQQAAYWKTQARKHEDRVKGMADYDALRKTADDYQRLVQASQTEQERAVAEARQSGASEALAKVGGELVEQWMRAAIGTRLDEDRVNTVLDGLDRSRFLDQHGRVNTAKVQAYADNLIPASAAAAPAASTVPEAGSPAAVPAQPQTAPPRGMDFGQGQPSRARPTGIEAGREIARLRFGTQPTTTPAATT